MVSSNYFTWKIWLRLSFSRVAAARRIPDVFWLNDAMRQHDHESNNPHWYDLAQQSESSPSESRIPHARGNGRRFSREPTRCRALSSTYKAYCPVITVPCKICLGLSFSCVAAARRIPDAFAERHSADRVSQKPGRALSRSAGRHDLTHVVGQAGQRQNTGTDLIRFLEI
jgi:hypothetical protein